MKPLHKLGVSGEDPAIRLPNSGGEAGDQLVQKQLADGWISGV
jgi:hypothetical protein